MKLTINRGKYWVRLLNEGKEINKYKADQSDSVSVTIGVVAHSIFTFKPLDFNLDNNESLKVNISKSILVTFKQD